MGQADNSGGSSSTGIIVAVIVIVVVVAALVFWNNRRRRSPILPFSNPDGDATLSIADASYLGGHPNWGTPTRHVVVVLDSDGFCAVVNGNVLVLRDWDQLVALNVDGVPGVQGRVTAVRILFLGLFAWAFKKKDRLSYLQVSDSDGTFIFEVTSLSAMELRAALQVFQPLVVGDPVADADTEATAHPGASATLGNPLPPPPPPAAGPAGHVADIGARLARVDELHRSGAITAEEHSEQRRRILDEA